MLQCNNSSAALKTASALSPCHRRATSDKFPNRKRAGNGSGAERGSLLSPAEHTSSSSVAGLLLPPMSPMAQISLIRTGGTAALFSVWSVSQSLHDVPFNSIDRVTRFGALFRGDHSRLVNNRISVLFRETVVFIYCSPN